MATTAISVSRPTSLGRRIIALIPGLLLLAAVGYAGKFIEQSIAVYTKSHHITLPNIEYVLWAIVIGLLIANTTGVPQVFQPGVATYEVLAEGGNRSAWFAIPSRRCSAPGRNLTLAGGRRSLALDHIHAPAGPQFQAQAQAHFAACHWFCNLRRVCHHRRQALY